MKKSVKEKNADQFANDYFKLFDSETQNQKLGSKPQFQWKKEGDNFEIFTLFQKGYTKLSNETELLTDHAKLEGSS
ncbi:MAG: hypothetical protein ACFHWX_20260 [Bacteroidota bacterium]